jgi:hypothetical protein
LRTALLSLVVLVGCRDAPPASPKLVGPQPEVIAESAPLGTIATLERRFSALCPEWDDNLREQTEEVKDKPFTAVVTGCSYGGPNREYITVVLEPTRAGQTRPLRVSSLAASTRRSCAFLYPRFATALELAFPGTDVFLIIERLSLVPNSRFQWREYVFIRRDGDPDLRDAEGRVRSNENGCTLAVEVKLPVVATTGSAGR